MPRPSSPLYAKASVRSPSTLDRFSAKLMHGCSRRLERNAGGPCLIFVRQCLLSNATSKLRGAGHVLPSRCQCRPTRGSEANLMCDHLRSCAQAANRRAVSVSATNMRSWWSQTESNRRHPACKAGALPTELRPRIQAAGRRARWWVEEDLNLRPHAYQACALTT